MFNNAQTLNITNWSYSSLASLSYFTTSRKEEYLHKIWRKCRKTTLDRNTKPASFGIIRRTKKQKSRRKIYFITTVSKYMSRGSSGSMVSDYGPDNRAIEVQSPTGAEDFSSSPCVQTSSGAHPASYQMGTGGPFPGGKAWPRRDTDHSPPSSAEVKYE
jgi:hypothetical protein